MTDGKKLKIYVEKDIYELFSKIEIIDGMCKSSIHNLIIMQNLSDFCPSETKIGTLSNQ